MNAPSYDPETPPDAWIFSSRPTQLVAFVLLHNSPPTVGMRP